MEGTIRNVMEAELQDTWVVSFFFIVINDRYEELSEKSEVMEIEISRPA